jgi:membrane carboxypeptidase/penicillin-binding protein PbpC
MCSKYMARVNHLRKLQSPRYRLLFIALFFLAVFAALFTGKTVILHRYTALQSHVILDRNGQSLYIGPNKKSEYSRYETELPNRVAELLVKKEDRFFYMHPGVNPASIIRATIANLSGEKGGGASTITMQLVKNVLENESDRSFVHKVQELLLALDLELFLPKKQILTMYSNTVYLGNNIQGLAYGSEAYFGKQLDKLSDTEILALLATLGSPSSKNPWTQNNQLSRETLAVRLGLPIDAQDITILPKIEHDLPYNLELASLHPQCDDTCTTTLDAGLTNQLRTILKEHVTQGWSAGARNGAIVVLKLPENELLAIVGSPDPEAQGGGAQINMALQPRPIGSTIKPLIYVKGFEAGLRPYSLVDDREYKFPTADGFPLYPKNYDGTYRGIVSLHYALANSLNVPSVKVLQHVGLENFYNFLQNTLGFEPLKDLGTYQYGIALGGLEMDTLTLARLFSIFPNQGVLRPLTLFSNSREWVNVGNNKSTIATPMSTDSPSKQIADPRYIQLVSRVLSDRTAGVEQFGLASSLNLSQRNYGVKTGTSRDFHDSWTIGYTPDFLIAVWLGNAENEPLKQISGAQGAGAIWHDAMELLMNSPYNHETPLQFEKTTTVQINDATDFGLSNEEPGAHQNILVTKRDLITSPHDGDVFQLSSRVNIPLLSSEQVAWYVNGEPVDSSTRFDFRPAATGSYLIEAVSRTGQKEKVRITLQD